MRPCPIIGIGIGISLRSQFAAFSGLLTQFPGAAAAYSLRRLGSYGGPVVEVRRSSDSDTESFTENQITSGAMLDFVVSPAIQAKYNDAMSFDGLDTETGLTVGAGTDPYSFGGKAKVELTATFFAATVGGSGNDTIYNQSINGGSGGVILSITTGGLVRIAGRSQAADSFQTFSHSMTIDAGTIFTVSAYLDFANDELGISLNGGAYETSSATFGSSTYVHGFPTTIPSFGFSDGASNTTFHGSLYDTEVRTNDTLVSSYNGDGNLSANWEDQTGAVDGTVVGSPATFTGQGFDGFTTEREDQSRDTVRNATQATTTEQPKIVDAGSVVLDGNGNTSEIWDGIDDDLDVIAGFAGLTSANVYAVTDNAGVVTIDTLTAQNISAATNLSTILTSLTYDKVTAIIIYPDATDQAGIESALSDLFE